MCKHEVRDEEKLEELLYRENIIQMSTNLIFCCQSIFADCEIVTSLDSIAICVIHLFTFHLPLYS